jgi:hypothetical protein
MPTFRNRLPQLDGSLFLTDGGIETDLIFNDGLELPHFAAFHLLKDEKGTSALRAYFTRYVRIALANGAGFILESPTWRASADWGDKLGYSLGCTCGRQRPGHRPDARAARAAFRYQYASFDQRLRRSTW